jgi:hypothetical protein
VRDLGNASGERSDPRAVLHTDTTVFSRAVSFVSGYLGLFCVILARAERLPCREEVRGMSSAAKRATQSAGEGVAIVAVLWVGLKGAGRWRLLARLSGPYSSEGSEREYVAERAPASGGFLWLHHCERTSQKAPPGSQAAARCALHSVPVLASPRSPSLSPLSVPPIVIHTLPNRLVRLRLTRPSRLLASRRSLGARHPSKKQR